MRRAIYPGSFDPVTNGHVDVIERARKLFDEIIVAVAHNDEKQPLFTLEERLDLLKTTVGKIDNVRNGINYGSNKVRFTNPVQVGARIRGRQKLLAADDMPNGGIRMTYQWTVEIEGKERPACVAETMSIAYAKT